MQENNLQKRIREMFVVDIFPTIANLLFGELSVNLKHDSTFYRQKKKKKERKEEQ